MLVFSVATAACSGGHNDPSGSSASVENGGGPQSGSLPDNEIYLGDRPAYLHSLLPAGTLRDRFDSCDTDVILPQAFSHTTTDILATALVDSCRVPPNVESATPFANVECCTSDLTLAEFKSLRGKRDGSDPSAATVESYLAGTEGWTGDASVDFATLMTHSETVRLFDSLGVNMIPELKSAQVALPFDGNYTRESFMQQLLDEYRVESIDPQRVRIQSFELEDIRWLSRNAPEFANGLVYLDGRYRDPEFSVDDPTRWTPSMTELRDAGVVFLAPPIWMLITLNEAGDMVPSLYATAASEAGLRLLSWSLERAVDASAGGGWYYQSVADAVLYHLAERGETDVVLLDMNELTSGSTWHAAGNIPTYSSDRAMLRVQHYSTELYTQLSADDAYPFAYNKTGSIRLARTEERWREFKRVTAMANALDYGYELMSAEQARDRFYPQLNTDDIVGVLWDPNDGDVDPSQMTQAMASAARRHGARVVRFCPVTAIDKTDTGWRVTTANGTIDADIVVNAGGYRGAEVAALIGEFLPMVALEHQYLVTEAVPELQALDAKIPLLRDPDASYYLRQEKHGLILGPYEKGATPRWTDGVLPEDFAYQLWPDDLDRLEWYIEEACNRMPLLGTVGVCLYLWHLSGRWFGQGYR